MLPANHNPSIFSVYPVHDTLAACFLWPARLSHLEENSIPCPRKPPDPRNAYVVADPIDCLERHMSNNEKPSGPGDELAAKPESGSNSNEPSQKPAAPADEPKITVKNCDMPQDKQDFAIQTAV